MVTGDSSPTMEPLPSSGLALVKFGRRRTVSLILRNMERGLTPYGLTGPISTTDINSGLADLLSASTTPDRDSLGLSFRCHTNSSGIASAL